MRTSVEFVLVHDGDSNQSRRVSVRDEHGSLNESLLFQLVRDHRANIELPKRLVEETLVELQALKITKITMEKVVRELKGGRKNIVEETANTYWETMEKIRGLNGLRACDLGFVAIKYLEEKAEVQNNVSKLTREFEELAEDARRNQRRKNGNIIQF